MKLIPQVLSLLLISAIQLGCSKAPVKDYTIYLPDGANGVITQRIQQGIDYSIYLKATVTPEGFKEFCDNLELKQEPEKWPQSEFVDDSIREWWLIPKSTDNIDFKHYYFTRNLYDKDNPERITDVLSAFYYNGSVYFQHTNL